MEGVPRRGRKVLAPEPVDECVDADDPAGPEREHRKQCLTLGAAHVRRAPARENLERAEKPDFQQLLHGALSAHESRTRRQPTHPLWHRIGIDRVQARHDPTTKGDIMIDVLVLGHDPPPAPERRTISLRRSP